jgi:hypothetical protein
MASLMVDFIISLDGYAAADRVPLLRNRRSMPMD